MRSDKQNRAIHAKRGYDIYIKRLGRHPIKITAKSLEEAKRIRAEEMMKVAIRPKGNKGKLKYQ